MVLAQVDVRSGVEKIIGDLGPYPAAFAYGSLVVMIPFRGFSLAPDGKSFLTFSVPTSAPARNLAHFRVGVSRMCVRAGLRRSRRGSRPETHYQFSVHSLGGTRDAAGAGTGSADCALSVSRPTVCGPRP